MNHIDSKRLIALLIDYFETGNTETDTMAKMILKSSPDYNDYWKSEVERIQAGIHWTGIRAVEAEMLSHALRELQGVDDAS